MNRLTCLLGICVLASACVDAGAKQPLGNAEFASGASLSSADYAQAAAPPAGSANPAAPNAAAPAATVPVGASGSPAVPPPAAMAGGAPATPMAAGPAGRGATALAGRAAAAGGGAIPPLGAAGMTAAAAGAAAPGGSAGKLTIDFKSVAVGGRYAPRNVGAVWIETSSGMFVKTLERWAGIRAVHLSRWSMASGGWGSRFGGGGGNTADMMDAVSRATLRAHEVHHLMWDLQDASGKTVPDGKYNLMIEVADDNFAASTSSSASFDKGPAPQTVMVPDKSPFSGLVIAYQP